MFLVVSMVVCGAPLVKDTWIKLGYRTREDLERMG